MNDTGTTRARRWFWALTITAIAAMGLLYRLLGAAASPGTALLVLVSSLVLVASTIQAARILVRLTGPARPRRR